MQTTVQGAVALKDNLNLFEKDGKIWAKTNWLRLWPKNPRVIDNKNLKKLEAQIKELGVYKPLVITPDGEILGGNQRFKVISQLAKQDVRFENVWVSVVEAWTDTERLKYALSDNFSAGEYTREKLSEVVKLDQTSMFDAYDISFEDKKTIQQFVDELAMTETELKAKEVDKILKGIGIDNETIQDIKMMSSLGGEFSEEKIEAGSGVCQFNDKKVFVIKMIFDEAAEKEYNELAGAYGKKGSAFEKTRKLINYLKDYRSMLETERFKQEINS